MKENNYSRLIAVIISAIIFFSIVTFTIYHYWDLKITDTGKDRDISALKDLFLTVYTVQSICYFLFILSFLESSKTIKMNILLIIVVSFLCLVNTAVLVGFINLITHGYLGTAIITGILYLIALFFTGVGGKDEDEPYTVLFIGYLVINNYNNFADYENNIENIKSQIKTIVS